LKLESVWGTTLIGDRHLILALNPFLGSAVEIQSILDICEKNRGQFVKVVAVFGRYQDAAAWRPIFQSQK
jgi:hypothetical protein